MRWVVSQGCRRLLAVPVAALAVLANAGIPSALDLDLTTTNSFTASDNIQRASEGNEVSGTISSQLVGLGISGAWSPDGSIDMLVEGGWETVDGETMETEDIMRLRIDAEVPWSATGGWSLSARRSRETDTPDPGALDQRRLLTERSQAVLGVKGAAGSSSRWSVDLSAREEERTGRRLTEYRSGLQWSGPLGRRWSLGLETSLTEGEDEVPGSEWRNEEATLALTRRLSTVSTLACTLQWTGSLIEEEGSDRLDSGKVGAQISIRRQTSPAWSHYYALGADRLKTAREEIITEPRGEITIQGKLSRTTALDLGALVQTRLSDPLDDDPSESRSADIKTGLTWIPHRRVFVEPSASWGRSELLGDGSTRDDETVSYGVGVRWEPGPSWRVGLGVLAQERDSTDDAYDLTENRFNVSISGSF